MTRLFGVEVEGGENREALIERVGRAIAADQGEAYAEHMSEYRQYASIAVNALAVSDALEVLRDVVTFAELYHGKMEDYPGDEVLAALGDAAHAAIVKVEGLT